MTSTTTDPETDDQVDDDTSSQGQTRPGATDADLAGIDEALKQAVDAEQASISGGLDSLEAQVRLLTPRHAVWKSATVLPAKLVHMVSTLAEAVGADQPDMATGYIVSWTTGAGDWQPTGLYTVMWSGCQDHDGHYRVKLDGPGVEVERERLTVHQVVELMKVTGFVR